MPAIRRIWRWAALALIAAGLSVALMVSAAAAGTPSITEMPVSADPIQIVTGPDGNLWYTQVGGVDRVIPSGPNAGQDTGYGSIGASGIVSADGAVWYAFAGSTGGIGCITMSGSTYTFPTPGGTSSIPDGITVGPDANLWFTDVGTNEIGRATPSATTPCTLTSAIAEFPVAGGVTLAQTSGGNPQTGADSIASTGTDLVFTEPGSGSIGEMSTTGTYLATFPHGGQPALPGDPYGIVKGPDGNFWFTQAGGSDALGRLDLTSGTITQVPTGEGSWSILSGPDGNLWFGHGAGSAPAGVGCVTTSGEVGSYAAPTLSANPAGLTIGADGALWFAEGSAGKLGRLSPVQCNATGGTTTTTPAPGTPPPSSSSPPVVSGTPKPGHTLSCGPGAWSNSPTRYAYQWYRNGTALAGATGPTHAVATLDEGTSLTCSVTATNAGGSASATAVAVRVPIPFVARCPGATGSMTGTRIGQISLSMTRAQARFLYRHHSNRGKRYMDFFCLTPIGVRVGYASPLLLQALPRGDRARYRARVVWASTSNPHYALDGIRPGQSITTAAATLGAGPPLHIGLNYWYLARRPGYTAVLKVRAGVVEELGIAIDALTATRTSESVLMHSFY